MKPIRVRTALVAIMIVCAMILSATYHTYNSSTKNHATYTFSGSQNDKDFMIEGPISIGYSMDEMYRKSKQVDIHLFTYNKRLMIPTDDYLQTLDRAHLEDLYHRYVENTQQACGNMIHYGLEMDGGYYFCQDVELEKPCLMYSFGTRNDYSFDDRIANTVGCDVHSFDPGDGQKDHRQSERIWFHAFGLGSFTRDIKEMGSTWKIYSLDDIRRLLKHTERVLDILKIDTEGMIWETLTDLTNHPEKIADVKYLIVELHTNFPGKGMPEYRTKPEYIAHLNSLRKLYNLGFRIYFTHRWHICELKDDKGETRTGCHDVHFMRV